MVQNHLTASLFNSKGSSKQIQKKHLIVLNGLSYFILFNSHIFHSTQLISSWCAQRHPRSQFFRMGKLADLQEEFIKVITLIQDYNPISPYIFILCLFSLILHFISKFYNLSGSYSSQIISLYIPKLLLNKHFYCLCNKSGQIFRPNKSKLFFLRNTPEKIQNAIATQVNIPIVEDLREILSLLSLQGN